MQVTENIVCCCLPFVSVFSFDLSLIITAEELLRISLQPAAPGVVIVLAAGHQAKNLRVYTAPLLGSNLI